MIDEAQEAQEAQEQRKSPYEGFRDSFPLGEDSYNDPKMAVHWRSADRWRQHLRDQIAEIEADPELSEEGKEARLQRAYDNLAPKIQQAAQAAREKAAKIAADAERRSIPGVPSAKVETDPAVQTNVLMESQEIRERASRIREQTPDGLNAPGRVMQMLREEYGEALQTGGLAGATTCAAVLRAAKVLGIRQEDVYDGFRTDAHRAALEEASRYREAEQIIPAHVPSLDRGRVVESHWRKGGVSRLAIPKDGALVGGRAKRKPSWK